LTFYPVKPKYPEWNSPIYSLELITEFCEGKKVVYIRSHRLQQHIDGANAT